MYELLNASGGPTQMEMSAGAKHLDGTSKIQVKQKVNKCEVLTCNCFESGNKYEVFADGTRAFYAHETTGCCTRQFQNCFPECAAWELTIEYVGGNSSEPAFHMTKACTPCTFLCINRPITYVTDNAGNQLGSIRDPCALCPTNMTFTVRDENEDTLYTAESGCCQWGLCCPMPCGPCRVVNFDVKDAEGNDVGHMEKKMKGCMKTMCCSCCFDDVESYRVDLDDIKDARGKALLMALAVFTDYRYFSNTAEPEVPDA